MSFTKRALGALAAGAITLPFLASPALAAPGDTPIPPVRDISAFCANPTASQFTDVQATDVFALAIRCIATAGITQGNPGTPQQPQGIGADKYGPTLEVTRGQMSSFIARMIDAMSAREVNEQAIRELPTANATNPFPGDVPNNYVHLNNIKRLSQAGIVEGNPGTAQQPGGIGANRFGPDLPVTRSQMASFINRAVAYVTTNLGPQAVRDNAGVSAGFQAQNAEYYVDAQQQVHVRNVNGITSARIAQGVGGQRYNGLGNVTRAQMAGFIARTLATFFESDRSGVADERILGLLNVFSANFPDSDRAAATRLAVGSTAASTRDYAATGLRTGVEYRITLVDADLIRRATDGTNAVFFTRDTSATPTARGNFLAAAGDDPAFFTSVNGGTPQNNDGTGNTRSDATNSRTVVVTPDANGAITFRIDASGNANVVPVIYINGEAGNSLANGGDSPRLELDSNGRAVEFFGLAGRTQFGAVGAALAASGSDDNDSD